MFHWHFVWRLTLTNKNKKKIETFQNVQKFACGIHANITYLLRNIIGYPNKNIKLFVRYHCSTVVENGRGRRKGANAVNESKTGNRLPNVSWVLKHATIQRRLNEHVNMNHTTRVTVDNMQYFFSEAHFFVLYDDFVFFSFFQWQWKCSAWSLLLESLLHMRVCIYALLCCVWCVYGLSLYVTVAYTLLLYIVSFHVCSQWQQGV